MKRYSVTLYEKPNGRVQVMDYLLALDSELKAKILHTIELLEELGSDLKEPLIKSIKGNQKYSDLMEIKVKKERILFKVYGSEAVLLYGFTKKSGHTPKKELEKARNFRIDYERRNRK